LCLAPDDRDIDVRTTTNGSPLVLPADRGSRVISAASLADRRGSAWARRAGKKSRILSSTS